MMNDHEDFYLWLGRNHMKYGYNTTNWYLYSRELYNLYMCEQLIKKLGNGNLFAGSIKK